jgi:hypothetical protein
LFCVTFHERPAADANDGEMVCGQVAGVNFDGDEVRAVPADAALPLTFIVLYIFIAKRFSQLMGNWGVAKTTLAT